MEPPPKDSPYDQKEQDVKGKALVSAEKAYKNEAFLMSRDARGIRIMCEFEETLSRLKRNGVQGTFLFFGSARAMYRNDWTREFALTKKKAKDESLSEQAREAARAKVERLTRTEWLCEYMDKAERLAKLLTEWAMTDEIRMISSAALPAGGNSLRQSDPAYLTEPCLESKESLALFPQKYIVSTGGGPGLMEAANRGASSVLGSRTAGFAISLPFEKGLNPFVTPELAFTFHYFFTRKYWMMYPAKVLIVLPGGFGTFDELFESVTLKQTGKKPPFPVVLIGKKYWGEVVNWSKLAEYGTISQADCDQFFITDDVDDAFEYIKRALVTTGHSNPTTPKKRGSTPAAQDLGPALKKLRSISTSGPDDEATPLSPSMRPMD